MARYGSESAAWFWQAVSDNQSYSHRVVMGAQDNEASIQNGFLWRNVSRDGVCLQGRHADDTRWQPPPSTINGVFYNGKYYNSMENNIQYFFYRYRTLPRGVVRIEQL